MVIEPRDWQRHGGDARWNEIALWLKPGADANAVIERVRALAGHDMPIESATAGELRALSLAIFDRSFAVTRYLQIVAIAVGLVGVAASLSAQVLARRKEFGLLAHLGLTRKQVLALVAGEAAVWLASGVALGTLLGIAVSVVLVTWSIRRASTGPCRCTYRRYRWRAWPSQCGCAAWLPPRSRHGTRRRARRCWR